MLQKATVTWDCTRNGIIVGFGLECVHLFIYSICQTLTAWFMPFRKCHTPYPKPKQCHNLIRKQLRSDTGRVLIGQKSIFYYRNGIMETEKNIYFFVKLFEHSDLLNPQLAYWHNKLPLDVRGMLKASTSSTACVAVFNPDCIKQGKVRSKNELWGNKLKWKFVAFCFACHYT